MKRRSFFGGLAAAGRAAKDDSTALWLRRRMALNYDKREVREGPVFESQRTKEMLFPIGPYTQHIPENAVKLVSVELGVFA